MAEDKANADAPGEPEAEKAPAKPAVERTIAAAPLAVEAEGSKKSEADADQDEDEDDGDEDEHDEDDGDEPEDEDEAAAEPAPPPPKATPAPKPAAPKPVAKAEPAKSTPKPAPRAPEPAINPVALGVRAVTPPPPAASLGKSVTAFMFILVVLAAGFWFLGTAESPFNKGGGQPKWKLGTTVPITLTLDPKDDDNLACASDAEIGGKHCEFKSKTERYPTKLDENTQLRPYKTTADEPLLAAGVWSAPEIAKGKRPTGRFNYKCQFKVEGKVTKPAVRWAPNGGWGDQDVDWFAGSVSDCTIEK